MAKRPRKKLIVLLISLVVLIALVVIGDRVAAAAAEGKLSDAVADKVTSSGADMKRPPDVSITGFPFLTQVIGGEYSEIDITLTDVSDEDISMPKVDIKAMDVTAAASDVVNGSGPITAGSMKATANVSYDSFTSKLEDITDTKITPKDGKLNVEATVNVQGRAIAVVGTAAVTIADNKLSLQAENFQPKDAQLPPGSDQILNNLSQSFNRQIPLPDLPFDLKLSDPQLNENDIALTATAKDVPLSS
ncbi:MAG TPA: DUF2993 domain-containing protein [Stackebrandtia sp.]|jgi:hypothetical protein|uniref:LmeA family phospholipid-binding protein n=1 Tax=Stackebrandtia sp. TaxID=2023065 RepID=UPI002D6DD8BB|nr:DUF2993 domain-containing protein [Stackebrandtia sp.]HZE39496.1 DUF2993 domain-containing protein [Stackebrandtia sp.]